MKTNEAKSYDEIYAELRPKNLSLDQYDMHVLVGQAYADQQVNKVLYDAIQRVNNLKSLENFNLAEALYDQCLNMLRSLKIKQP